MMVIDMTRELAPFLYGLNVVLVVSAVAIVSRTNLTSWLRSVGRFRRPRPVFTRPVLVR